MEKIQVNFAETAGKVKIMNAINNGPIVNLRGINNVESWKQANIPYARLHDTSFFNEWLVDVHRIFRDFDADENDPANYIFAPTDGYLSNKLLANGTKPYYRLGASIEHSHKFGTYPPKDFLKWARICEHIIRHYTEGWADGFHMDIEYWEIWNEPDNYNANGNPCWQSTVEEFTEFFSVVCPYLQKQFPHLKIGGPAIATVHHDEWCAYFFSEIQKRGIRPDFISYHRYTKSVDDFIEYVRKANGIFEKYGFGDVETHLNEWNYIRGWRGEDFIHSVKALKGLKGASFVAGVMCAMQAEKLDMLMYYDAQLREFCGLWDGTFLTPTQTHSVFCAFDHLRTLGTAVKSTNGEFLYSLGATDGEESAVMFTYFNQDDDAAPQKEVQLELAAIPGGGMRRVQIHVLGEETEFRFLREELVTSDTVRLRFAVPIYSVYLIKVLPE